MEINLDKKRTLHTIFFTAEEPKRLRLLWRLAVFALLVVFGVGLLPLFLRPLIFVLHPQLYSVALAALKCGGMLAAVLVARKFIDRRSLRAMGLQPGRHVLADIGKGAGVALAMAGVFFLLSLAFGWISITGAAWQFAYPFTVIWKLALNLIVFIFSGVQITLMLYGYLFHNLKEAITPWWAAVIAALLFALTHLGYPDATWRASVALLVFGFLLAYAGLRSGGLWLPCSVLIFWRFFEGAVFGFHVNGVAYYTLFQQNALHDGFWQSTRYGAEGSLLMIPLLGLGICLIHILTGKRKKTEPANPKDV